MLISSPAFKDNDPIPKKYSYHGGNISPPLEFEEVPEDAFSLALLCHDPDAPNPGGFTHWLLWNIDPNVKKVPENSIPNGADEGVNDWGDTDWGGPAPPSGTHHYEFTLYALDKVLDLSSDTDRIKFMEAIEPHILETCVVTGTFSSDN